MKNKIKNWIKTFILALLAEELKPLQQVGQINARVDDLQDRHDDLKHDFDQLDVVDKDDLRDLEEKLEGEVKEWEDKHDDLERQVDRLGEKYDELNDEMEKLDTLKDKIDDIEANIENDLEDLPTEFTALKDQVALLAEKIDKSSDEALRKSMIDTLERLLFKLKVGSDE